jgi:hypothetical protein
MAIFVLPVVTFAQENLRPKIIKVTVEDTEGTPIPRITLIFEKAKQGEQSESTELIYKTTSAEGTFLSDSLGDYKLVGANPDCFAPTSIIETGTESADLILEWRPGWWQALKQEAGGTAFSMRADLQWKQAQFLSARISVPSLSMGYAHRFAGGGHDMNSRLECEKWDGGELEKQFNRLRKPQDQQDGKGPKQDKRNPQN